MEAQNQKAVKQQGNASLDQHSFPSS